MGLSPMKITKFANTVTKLLSFGNSALRLFFFNKHAYTSTLQNDTPGSKIGAAKESRTTL